MRHEPICLTTSKSFITGDAATPRSEAKVPQRFTGHGSRSSPSPSWRPERYRLVPENPMEGQCSIFWCSHAVTDALRRSSFASCCEDCSMCRGSSLQTNLAVMPPLGQMCCPVCCTYTTSERTIGLRARISQRGNASVECEASRRLGTPSVSSQPSESSLRSFARIAICWQPRTTVKSCVGASHNGRKWSIQGSPVNNSLRHHRYVLQNCRMTVFSHLT